jgi:hypothetical protein
MEIYKKLAKVKEKIGKISKDSTNPFYKSKYFDVNSLLEHVEPLLQENGLLLLQPISNGSVTTEIIDIDTGEIVSSGMDLTDIKDPQKRGSEVTYYRRYTLTSLLGLQAEDDDANSVTPKKAETSSEDKPWLNVGSKEWNGALEKGSSLSSLREYFKISKANAAQYETALKG